MFGLDHRGVGSREALCGKSSTAVLGRAIVTFQPREIQWPQPTAAARISQALTS
jgi:hypothetical protein